MNDPLTKDFLAGCLQVTELHHVQHLRIVWTLARQHDEQTALDLFSTGIQLWAIQHGYLSVYNEALTRYWVHMVCYEVSQHRDIADFEAFIAACPHLLDKGMSG